MKNDTLHSAQQALNKFNVVWESFKRAHDEDIAPALMAGSRLKTRATALTSV